MLKLVNLTPVPAHLHCAPGRKFQRLCMLVAKATFRHAGGRVELDTQSPLPIIDDDQEAELGVLPSDLMPPKGPGCEVIVLGRAHAPGGQPVESMTVALRVGAHERRLHVFGDRKWVEGQHGAFATRPAPFISMPLTWERAFGGRCKVWVDTDAIIEVASPLNARGRGFDPRATAKALCETLKAPPGFPVVDDVGFLPNLENPDQPIRSRRDDPLPHAWATIPSDIGMRCATAMLAAREGKIPPPAPDPVEIASPRAHPTWRLEGIEAGARVSMHGLHASGPATFSLPQIRVLADYVLGPERSGTLECRPYRLLFLPEEERVCICFCKRFVVDPIPWRDSSLRLRLEEGWLDP